MWTVRDHTQLMADIRIALGHTDDQGYIVTSAHSAKRVPLRRQRDRTDRPLRDGAHDHTGVNVAQLARLARIQAIYRELMSISTATSRRSRGLRNSDQPRRVTELVMRIRREADAFVEASEKVAAQTLASWFLRRDVAPRPPKPGGARSLGLAAAYHTKCRD